MHTRRTRAAHGVTSRGAWWRSAVDWRNWRLPVKLSAVALVPLAFVTAFACMQITAHATKEARYSANATKVRLAGDLRPVILAVQRERNVGAVAGAARGALSTSGARERQAPLDRAVSDLRETFSHAEALGQTVTTRWSDAATALDSLPSIRRQWAGHADAAIAGYSRVIDSLLDLDMALIVSRSEAATVGPAVARHDLDRATEEVYAAQAFGLAGITRGEMTRREVAGISESEVRRKQALVDFRSAATQEQRDRYRQAISGPRIRQRARELGALTRNSEGSQTTPAVSTPAWNASSKATTDAMGKVASRATDTVRSRSEALRAAQGSGLVVPVVLLVCALLATVLAVWLVCRQLLRSVRTLHRSATDVARRRLPQVAADIARGGATDTEIEPVPIHTTDELGRLAGAFDAVHGEARRLAAEQAGLRERYGEIFVNLSRRSQSLVQRQLRLVERLERDEEDPDHLSALFQLDHLATRMRRNNENLMVLSGSEPGRSTSKQPTDLGELLRAAVSEIEDYQRVTLQLPPTVLVLGHVGSDLVRLVAELLDNATAFSPPDTQVTLASHRATDGVVTIDIVDDGIGMSDKDLAQANDQLAGQTAADVPVLRRMGLFVVGRLSHRHGITVRLHGGNDIVGLRASITVPAEFTVVAEADAEPPPTVGSDAPPQDFAAFAPLPVRVPEQDDAASATEVADEPNADVHPDARADARADALRAGDGEQIGEITGESGLFAPAAPVAPERDEGGQAQATPGAREETPIFDEMLSAWFDPSGGASETLAEEEAWSFAEGLASGAAAAQRWEFAADDNWRAVADVVASQPTEMTAVGLPKRTPKARLLPGSAWPAEATDQNGTSVGGSPARDARTVRERLARFQQGVRDGSAAAAEGETGELARAPGIPEVPHAPAAPDDSHPSGLPQRRPRRVSNPDAATPEAVGHADSTETPDEFSSTGRAVDAGARWRFAADAGWKAVAEATDDPPEAVTGAGLPKRTPKARLVPGSAAMPSSEPSAGAAQAPRDPDRVRDRFARFQRGIVDGRKTVTSHGSDTQQAVPDVVSTEDSGVHAQRHKLGERTW